MTKDRAWPYYTVLRLSNGSVTQQTPKLWPPEGRAQLRFVAAIIFGVVGACLGSYWSYSAGRFDIMASAIACICGMMVGHNLGRDNVAIGRANARA